MTNTAIMLLTENIAHCNMALKLVLKDEIQNRLMQIAKSVIINYIHRAEIKIFLDAEHFAT